MIEHHIDIETEDGDMNTFITHPEEEGPHPVVLFLMDAPGKREELHDMARRIATVGYYVMLPNLYYRSTREFELASWDEEDMKKMFSLIRSLTNGLVMKDIGVMLDYADNQNAAALGSVGVVGYCMSGPFAFAAASAHADRVAASASIYGAGLITDRDDSPHINASDITGEMYFACAEIDEYAPKEKIKALDKHLSGTNANYRIEWYPGAEHGFAFPLREGLYHKPSAERHWERLFALFKRNLP